jgi:hypothetical protein
LPMFWPVATPPVSSLLFLALSWACLHLA